MGEWAKPDNFFAIFRLTELRYANEFIENGTIKFNTPQSWIDYYNKFGAGRGDQYEGTLAFCNIDDVNRYFELRDKYSSKNVMNNKSRQISYDFAGNRILFKDKRALGLPCFCFYTLKHRIFSCSDLLGDQKITAEIPPSYFRDFSNNLTQEENSKLDKDQQQAIIFIKDYEKFKSRMFKALITLGFEEKEIIINHVVYYDYNKYGKNSWLDFGKNYPEELFIKEKYFIDQSETRIVINSKKKDLVEKLIMNTINIGNMMDIAEVTDKYLYDGMKIEGTVNICEED